MEDSWNALVDLFTALEIRLILWLVRGKLYDVFAISNRRSTRGDDVDRVRWSTVIRLIYVNDLHSAYVLCYYTTLFHPFF
jgi:hypothetical protein